MSDCNWCGEKLEVVNVDDEVRKGRLYDVVNGLIISFANVVQPVPNGPIYHIHCFHMMEKKKENVKKEKSPVTDTSTDSFQGFTFDYSSVCLINKYYLGKACIIIS